MSIMSATTRSRSFTAEERTELIQEVLSHGHSYPRVEALYFTAKRRNPYMNTREFRDMLALYTATFIQFNHPTWRVQRHAKELATEEHDLLPGELSIDYSVTDTSTGVTIGVVQPYVDDATPPHETASRSYSDIQRATELAEDAGVPLVFALDSAGWVEGRIMDMMWADSETQINKWGTVTTAKRLPCALATVFSQHAPLTLLSP